MTGIIKYFTAALSFNNYYSHRRTHNVKLEEYPECTVEKKLTGRHLGMVAKIQTLRFLFDLVWVASIR
jgi:hypothetical protein